MCSRFAGVGSRPSALYVCSNFRSMSRISASRSSSICGSPSALRRRSSSNFCRCSAAYNAGRSPTSARWRNQRWIVSTGTCSSALIRSAVSSSANPPMRLSTPSQSFHVSRMSLCRSLANSASAGMPSGSPASSSGTSVSRFPSCSARSANSPNAPFRAFASSRSSAPTRTSSCATVLEMPASSSRAFSRSARAPARLACRLRNRARPRRKSAFTMPGLCDNTLSHSASVSSNSSSLRVQADKLRRTVASRS
mmetsp:Transcript_18555/g.60458  ORF Transcript_18555/g.60458 Transcript_18555/m.60458 type:complete len:252 (-) Transcript_18555:414-1169(-)